MAIDEDRIVRMARRVKFRDMNVFHAVANAGSMAKAASKLAVAQPVVSKTIKALEQLLGVPLFDRSSRGIELTGYGQVLLAKTRVVFAEIDEAIRGIEFLKDPTVGEVRIASPESMTMGLLPLIIDRFTAANPGALLQVLQANTFPLDFQVLRERRVDLMMGRIAPEFNEPDLEAEVLFQEELVAVVGQRHPLARKRSLRLSDMLGEKWILAPADTAAGSLWAEAFEANNLPLPKVSISTFSMNLRNPLVATGRYVTMMPRSLWKSTAKQSSGIVLPIKLSLRRAPVAIITIKGRGLSPMVARFAAAIRTECKAQGLK